MTSYVPTGVSSNVIIECPPCPFCKGPVGFVEVSTDGYRAWVAGTFIQEAFPEISAWQREMIFSGVHKDCWEDKFGVEE